MKIDTTFNPRRAAKLLNEHCMKGNGFYGSVIGNRWFGARVRAGVLEVWDFDNWRTVTEAEAVFHDHNGQEIFLH